MAAVFSDLGKMPDASELLISDAELFPPGFLNQQY